MINREQHLPRSVRMDPLRTRLMHPLREEDDDLYGVLLFRKEFWYPLSAHDTFTTLQMWFDKTEDNPLRTAYVRKGLEHLFNEHKPYAVMRSKSVTVFNIPVDFNDYRCIWGRGRPLALLNHIHPQYHPV